MKMPVRDAARLAFFFAEAEESYLRDLFAIAAGVLRKRLGSDEWSDVLRKLLARNAAYRAMEEACDHGS